MRAAWFSLFTGIAAAAYATSAIAFAPETLRNKSFTISWNEEHNQSRDGGPFRDVSVAYTWTLYISSAGRGFSRLHISSSSQTTDRGRAGSRQGAETHENVGKGTKSFGGGEHAMKFTASGFVQAANFGNAARQISVDVTGSGCSAQVTVGLAQGAASASFNHTNGRHFEIRSLHAGSASCRLQDGNAFAN